MFNIQNAFNQCKAFDKGRWYTNFIESDGTAISLTKCEIISSEYSASSTVNLYTPKNFVIVDVMVDIHFITPNSGVTIVHGCSNDTEQYRIGLSGLSITRFDYMYVYIFGYFTEIPEQTRSAQALSAKMNSNEMVEMPISDETPTKIKL